MSAWRLPPRVPGEARTTYDPELEGDWTYPEEMHRDAFTFWMKAQDVEVGGDPDRDRDRWVRAGVVSAFEWFEAQLNRASLGHARAHGEALDPLTLDVLLDRETVIDERGRVVERRRRMGLATRLLFLTAVLSGEEFPRGTQLWERFQSCIELRDSIVHPKPPFPWEFPADRLRETLDTLVEVLVTVHRLLEQEPAPWWKPVQELLAQEREKSSGGEGAD